MKAILILFFAIDTAMAAGGYEQGPLSSLILPALNFGAVAIFLVFVLRKPMRNFFNKNAEDVVQLYYHAEEKEKEAEIKLNMYKAKLKNLASEKNKIKEMGQKEIEEFEKKTKEETALQLSKLDEDAKSKMDYEMTMMMRELNESLLDEVISKTKATVTGDSSMKSTITHRLSNEVNS